MKTTCYHHVNLVYNFICIFRGGHCYDYSKRFIIRNMMKTSNFAPIIFQATIVTLSCLLCCCFITFPFKALTYFLECSLGNCSRSTHLHRCADVSVSFLFVRIRLFVYAQTIDQSDKFYIVHAFSSVQWLQIAMNLIFNNTI